MKLVKRFKKLLIQSLKINKLRFLVVKYRYLLLKNKIKFYKGGSSSINHKTVEYNLTAFDSDSAFGCGQRMGLLIYPVVAYNTSNNVDKSKLKVLIVGCRTEDDIFWMKSYGFSQTMGFDLFSYSKYVLLGDIHKTEFPNQSFDIILLGWILPYTKDPAKVLKECRRILKLGGLLGIGIDHTPTESVDRIIYAKSMLGEIPNSINTSTDIISLLDSTGKHKVLFEYNHYNEKDNDLGTAVVSVCN